MDDTAAAIAEQPAETPDVRAQISLVRLARITPSATNPRRTFNQAQLDELTDSVRQHGVLQPILVRPIVGTEDRFELVCGERRYRAAMAAELREVPALVRPLTDLQVLEVQLIENLQREGLHELEEAEGYERLIATHGYSVDDLAAKVGKSRSYVYQRMKLTDLGDRARKAFYAGKLSFSTALLIARIPTQDLQVKALAEITADRWDGGMSARMAADHIQRTYMLRLAEAPFPRHDAGLLPEAGACGDCPKRTGNQPELFGDVKSGDTCTDPACFGAKRDAHTARLKEQARERGQEVIVGKKAKALGTDLVELDRSDYSITGTGKTYKQLLGKDAPTPVLVEDHRGHLVEALPKAALVEALKEKGHKVAGARQSDEQAKREKQAKFESAVRQRLFEVLVPLIAERKHWDLRPIVAAMWDRMLHDTRMRYLKLKGWGEPEFAPRLAALPQQECYGLLHELALAGELHVAPYSLSSKPERMLALAKALDVDHAAIRKQVLADAKVAEKSKGKPKKASAPKPAARRAKSTPSTTAERAAAPVPRLVTGDTVKVRGRKDLRGRTPHFLKTLPGLVGTVLEAFTDGRVRVKFGPEHQHKAVWLQAREVVRIEAPAQAPAVVDAPAPQWAVGDRVKVRRDAKSSTGTRLKMVNREGVVTLVNGAQLVVDFGNRTYGKRLLSIDQVERIEAASAEGAQP